MRLACGHAFHRRCVRALVHAMMHAHDAEAPCPMCRRTFPTAAYRGGGGGGGGRQRRQQQEQERQQQEQQRQQWQQQQEQEQQEHRERLLQQLETP